MSSWAGLIGACLGALGVAAGAFGAHGLKTLLDQRGSKHIWDLAATYQLVHAVALVLVVLTFEARGSSTSLTTATVAFTAGIVLFSGSLYVLAVGGPRWMGPITPLGGTAFIVGWLALALAWRPA